MQTPQEKANPSSRKRALTIAVRDFLKALGCAEEGELKGTAERVAQLWDEILVPAKIQPMARPMPELSLPGAPETDVLLAPIDFHMVCPHHLTVAQGEADIAYTPGSHVLGLGEIAQIVRDLASDLILQETLGQRIAAALVQTHGAKAAWVRLRARHTCGSLSTPQTHHANLITSSLAGDATRAAHLRLWAEAEERRER